MTQLTKLDLSDNQLTSLPAEIGKLTQLTKLYLSDNQLTSLPAEIGQLTQLTELNLSNNQLTSLPAEIGNMTQLTELYLSNNQLTSLPDSIRRLSNTITLLNLMGNPLVEHGEGDTLGWRELREIFGNKVVLCSAKKMSLFTFLKFSQA